MTREQEWIKSLQQHWPSDTFRHDAYLDSDSGQILTTDMMVEDVHFSMDYFTPQDLGWKSIAISLSDIAATCGRPQWIMASIGLPKSYPMQWLNSLHEGIKACCNQFGCKLIGGDTVGSEKIILSITAIGQALDNCTPGRRDQAQPGDVIAISGHHGLSRAGLEALTKSYTGYDQVKQAHLKPIPLVKLGQRISRSVPRFSMMDSSDGLADAVLHLSHESNVDIYLDQSRLDIHPQVSELAEKANVDPLEWVLYGGEDFQLVVSLPREVAPLFPELTVVGQVLKSKHGQGHASMVHNKETILLDWSKTFQHFKELLPS